MVRAPDYVDLAKRVLKKLSGALGAHGFITLRLCQIWLGSSTGAWAGGSFFLCGSFERCIVPGGSVITWGDNKTGGDSSAAQHQLKNVQQIQATSAAFAAILGDGSVITWGANGAGGNSSS